MADYISREAAEKILRKCEALYRRAMKSQIRADMVGHCIRLIGEVPAADVRPVVKCLECENALRDDSHKIVHCNQNGEPRYVWCKKEGCCRAEDFFCANGVSCSCGAGMMEVKSDEK